MQFTVQDNIIKITVLVTLEPISAQGVQAQLGETGFSSCFLLQEQLANLLLEYQQLQQKIKDGLQPLGKALTYVIAEKRAAELTFSISEDKMQAAAVITAAWGGAPVSANELVKAAQDVGIVFGFSKEQVLKLVGHASKAEPGSKARLVIAKGRPMVQGDNSRFEPLIAEMASSRDKPVVEADEKADLRDFGEIPAIYPGQKIMRRHPPTSGTDGMTVTGELIPALPGMVTEWKLGEGVEISPDDPDVLLAMRDGLPRIIESGATVDEVFIVKNVDLASGHIIFRGSVVVNGDVTEGMKVIAGGNVFVKGFVEGALVEAGGDISITGSVIGHQLAEASRDSEYSTELKAKGNIQCNLAQYARFNCEGNVYVTKQLMHCSVSACKVYAGDEKKPSGKVIGGYFYLDQGLSTGNLGAPSGSAVLIYLNRQIDPIVEKQNVLRASVAAEKDEMAVVKERLEQLKKIESSPKIEQQRQSLADAHEAHRSLAVSLIDDIKLLEQQRRDKLNNLRVVVKQQLFSAVEVHFGSNSVRSRREYGPSKILIAEGEPEIMPL